MTKTADTVPPMHAFEPRVIAWEITRRCHLKCVHCRADAQYHDYDHELTTEEIFSVLQNIATQYRPILILTGGEPLLRSDVYDIAQRGTELQMRVVLASCGQLIDAATIKRLRAAGVQCLSISIDGAEAAHHDAFRGMPGAYTAAMSAIKAARMGGLPVQINTTVTRHNVDQLPAILDLARQLGAVTFNPFLLVPTGRGRQLANAALDAPAYEHALHWLADQQQRADGEMSIRVTCAPHYQRIIRQRGLVSSGSRPTGGCLGGKSFAFISYCGQVQICGFLEDSAGDLRQQEWDFVRIWQNSELFAAVRNVDGYQGKCGRCEYRRVCGGCRARAFALQGDLLGSEPFCVHEPAAQ